MGFIRLQIADGVVEAARVESVALRLGNLIRMTEGMVNVSVVSVAAAAFVGAGERKPVTQAEWTASRLEPEEIAAIVWVPDQFLDESGFPIWPSVRSQLAGASAKALDAAILYGTDAPSTYPLGGIAALAGAAAIGPDALDAVNSAANAVEETGLIPKIAAGSRI